MVPNVPPIAPYTLPRVSNVSLPPISSIDSIIISIAQIISSFQQQLYSLTQSNFNVLTCDMGSPVQK